MPSSFSRRLNIQNACPHKTERMQKKQSRQHQESLSPHHPPPPHACLGPGSSFIIGNNLPGTETGLSLLGISCLPQGYKKSLTGSGSWLGSSPSPPGRLFSCPVAWQPPLPGEHPQPPPPQLEVSCLPTHLPGKTPQLSPPQAYRQQVTFSGMAAGAPYSSKVTSSFSRRE